MAQDEESIAQTFRDYVQTFQTLQPHAVVPYCHVPCMFISSQGVRVLADANEMAALIGRLMEGLKAHGFSRSEITEMKVNQMSERTALVSIRKIRYKTDGSELERLGETYTFLETGGDWKIAAAVVYDPERILRLA